MFELFEMFDMFGMFGMFGIFGMFECFRALLNFSCLTSFNIVQRFLSTFHHSCNVQYFCKFHSIGCFVVANFDIK